MPEMTDLLFAPVEPRARSEPVAAETDEIVIVIDGRAVAKGRPRFTRQGFAFTLAKTRAYEAHAKLVAQEAMAGRPPLEGALACAVTVVLPIPQGFSRAKRVLALTERIFPTTRPDLDNYIKVLDALNSIVFRDDSQVVRLEATKRYGDDPRLEIRVRPLGGG